MKIESGYTYSMKIDSGYLNPSSDRQIIWIVLLDSWNITPYVTIYSVKINICIWQHIDRYAFDFNDFAQVGRMHSLVFVVYA